MRQRHSSALLTGTIESVFVIAFYAAKQCANGPRPRHAGEFIDGRNYETRETAVDGIVHCDNRERAPAAEGAIAISAANLEIFRVIPVGFAIPNQTE